MGTVCFEQVEIINLCLGQYRDGFYLSVDGLPAAILGKFKSAFFGQLLDDFLLTGRAPEYNNLGLIHCFCFPCFPLLLNIIHLAQAGQDSLYIQTDILHCLFDRRSHITYFYSPSKIFSKICFLL